MRRMLFIFLATLVVASAAVSATLVDIALDQQIDIGLGDAITGHDAFGEDSGIGYAVRWLTVGNGAGGWYWGPRVDLVRAGYGPYVDLSKSGAHIQYTTRYFQGDGNTNPYGDAPIMIELVDADGTSCEMGISYGPQPNPTYPEWQTVAENLSDAAPDLDLSRIVAVSFFGTDWAGTGNDFVQIRDLRFIDDTARDPISIPDAKDADDDAPVEIIGSVSASYSSLGRFYVQNSDNACGIQVRHSDVPNEGVSVYVKGAIKTDMDTDEMYIESSEWATNGPGNAKPRFMNNRSVGGSPMNRQAGAVNGSGVNNTGLLVTVAGAVLDKAEDSSWIRIWDGSIAPNGAASELLVSLEGVPFWQRPALSTGHRVFVAGISSLYRDDEDARRPLILMKGGGYRDHQSDDNEPKTFRVAVVNFDPYCPGHGNVRTHEVFGWNDPHVIANGYMNDLATASGGWCDYEIVDWFDADYHPYFEDGYQWGPDAYVDAWTTQTGLHEGTADYVRLLTDPTYPHNQPRSLTQRIADDEIDEVFFFGAPAGAAFYEAAMAGPSPFFVNGGTYTLPEAGRNFVIMGFNYERDVDCMLEDFLHRTECVMSRVYPSPDWWFPTYPPTNNWDMFRMIDLRGAGASAVGMCHYAPNSESDYDWGNTRFVWSTCDDWLYNWPDLQGDITKRLVNCTEWGSGDMRMHHLWWLNHLPKASGVNADTRQNNWWKYTCDFNNYPESR